MQFKHKPILLLECIEGLNINPKGNYLDGTLGGAGHSVEIVKNLDDGGTLIGIDQDSFAIKTSKDRLLSLHSKANLIFSNTNFEHLKKVCEDNNISNLDGVLLDLGVSSYQLDNPDRGFSYMNDAKLDMRMDKNSELTALEVVNNYTKEDLKRILYTFGEESWTVKIVEAILKERSIKKIETTFQLVDIIKSALPAKVKKGGKHPAKKTFQALRIEVNNELGVIGNTIKDAVSLLNKGGRICIITFHSLEDRIVKQEFTKLAKVCKCPPKLPMCMCDGKAICKIINKKPIIPSNDEIEQNPRARSAKLRVITKL